MCAAMLIQRHVPLPERVWCVRQGRTYYGVHSAPRAAVGQVTHRLQDSITETALYAFCSRREAERFRQSLCAYWAAFDKFPDRVMGSFAVVQPIHAEADYCAMGGCPLAITEENTSDLLQTVSLEGMALALVGHMDGTRLLTSNVKLTVTPKHTRKHLAKLYRL